MAEDELPEPWCADCIAFDVDSTAAATEAGTRRGRCRFRPELGLIAEDLPHCSQLIVRRERLGNVRVHRPAAARPRARPPAGVAARGARPTLAEPIQGDTSGEISMDREGLKQVLRELLEGETLYGYPEIGRRWEGGTMVMQPADASLQAKELPIEAFFHKIVMLRDRLRVLEAKINDHDRLSEQEKVELQGYVSKCYGTLTTFNVLFADKQDHFSSK